MPLTLNGALPRLAKTCYGLPRKYGFGGCCKQLHPKEELAPPKTTSHWLAPRGLVLKW